MTTTATNTENMERDIKLTTKTDTKKVVIVRVEDLLLWDVVHDSLGERELLFAAGGQHAHVMG